MIRSDVLVDQLISFLSVGNQSNRFLRQHVGAFAVTVLHDRVLADPFYRSQIRISQDNTGNQWKALARVAFEIFIVSRSRLSRR